MVGQPAVNEQYREDRQSQAETSERIVGSHRLIGEPQNHRTQHRTDPAQHAREPSIEQRAGGSRPEPCKHRQSQQGDDVRPRPVTPDACDSADVQQDQAQPSPQESRSVKRLRQDAALFLLLLTVLGDGVEHAETRKYCTDPADRCQPLAVDNDAKRRGKQDL